MWLNNVTITHLSKDVLPWLAAGDVGDGVVQGHALLVPSLVPTVHRVMGEHGGRPQGDDVVFSLEEGNEN